MIRSRDLVEDELDLRTGSEGEGEGRSRGVAKPDVYHAHDNVGGCSRMAATSKASAGVMRATSSPQ